MNGRSPKKPTFRQHGGIVCFPHPGSRHAPDIADVERTVLAPSEPTCPRDIIEVRDRLLAVTQKLDVITHKLRLFRLLSDAQANTVCCIQAWEHSSEG